MNLINEEIHTIGQGIGIELVMSIEEIKQSNQHDF